MRWTALLFVAALLSGCAATPGGPSSQDGNGTTPAGAETMEIHGIVADLALVPIAGANVTLLEQQVTVVSDASGAFAFPTQSARIHTVRASALGYTNQTLVARPEAETLQFSLVVDRSVIAPYNRSQTFKGHFDCAAEYVFIAGSCSAYFEFLGQEDPVFSNSSRFFFSTEPDWRTIVMDLSFEGQPTFDGLRITFRGKDDADALGDYQQYGRFQDSASFTTRISPGESYPDGDAGPVPGNITTFQADIYAQGFLYHPGGVPITGFGAGTNIDFQLIVTVFYVEPAPEGFSFLP